MRRFASMILAALAVVAAVFAAPAPALAEDIVAPNKWNVTYTNAGRMEDNYSAQEYIDQVSGLQPGDTITFTVNLEHANDDAADWYMQNEVIKTLEEQSKNNAKYSAYGYYLVYNGPSTSKVLYDSNTVGGDQADAGTEGLSEATSALDPEEYLFLDRLSKGQKATVTLKVSLDGETEGNAYFDTLGKLKMRFAVEPVTTSTTTTPPTTTENPPTTSTRTLVKTGDDVRLFPFYVTALVSGILLALLALYSVREGRRERAAAAAGSRGSRGTSRRHATRGGQR